MTSDLPRAYLDTYNRVARFLKGGKYVTHTGDGPPPAQTSTSSFSTSPNVTATGTGVSIGSGTGITYSGSTSSVTSFPTSGSYTYSTTYSPGMSGAELMWLPVGGVKLSFSKAWDNSWTQFWSVWKEWIGDNYDEPSVIGGLREDYTKWRKRGTPEGLIAKASKSESPFDKTILKKKK